uniref:DDE Tnp4 domain-containing protein n=1 Tax=Planktothricoides sp. SpSt-374 TaxID=2282167 RepID=A0A7C3ZVC7_9CYAN
MPTSSEEQKKFSSGKQKRHTLKNQLIVMPSGQEIVDVVAGEPGTTSDINIWRSRCAEFSKPQKFQGDKDYVGDPELTRLRNNPKIKLCRKISRD